MVSKDSITIGCHGLNGHQARVLGGSKELPNARVVGLSGVGEADFETVRQRNPHLAETLMHYPDLAAMLARDQIDLVSLCSPRRDRQADDIVRSLAAGKSVFAEKPLVTTLEDLARIRRAASESGKELRAMTGAPYEPHFRAMKEVVAGGQVGQVIQVCARKSYPYRDNRPQDRGLDGGLIMQAGIHAISVVRYVTGLEITAIWAVDTMLGNPKPGRLQMAASVGMMLSGGAVGTANFNYLNPDKIGFWGDDRLGVYGRGGMTETLEGGRAVYLTTHEQETRRLELPTEPPAAHLRSFIELLLTGKPMRQSAEDCLIETEIVIQAQCSADQGGVLMEIQT